MTRSKSLPIVVLYGGKAPSRELASSLYRARLSPFILNPPLLPPPNTAIVLIATDTLDVKQTQEAFAYKQAQEALREKGADFVHVLTYESSDARNVLKKCIEYATTGDIAKDVVTPLSVETPSPSVPAPIAKDTIRQFVTALGYFSVSFISKDPDEFIQWMEDNLSFPMAANAREIWKKNKDIHTVNSLRLAARAMAQSEFPHFPLYREGRPGYNDVLCSTQQRSTDTGFKRRLADYLGLKLDQPEVIQPPVNTITPMPTETLKPAEPEPVTVPPSPAKPAPAVKSDPPVLGSPESSLNTALELVLEEMKKLKKLTYAYDGLVVTRTAVHYETWDGSRCIEFNEKNDLTRNLHDVTCPKCMELNAYKAAQYVLANTKF